MVLRLSVCGETGQVGGVRWLVNTLRADPEGHTPPWAVVEAQQAAIAEHCCAARFQPSADGGGTEITLPLVFK